MKAILLLIFSLVAVSVFAQQPYKGPIMTFDQTNTPAPSSGAVAVHDFGDVIQGDSVKYTFVYRNTGTDTLKISNIVSSCGCTVSKEYDRVIPPGGSGKIVVKFNSTGKFGITNKSLTIFSNGVSKAPAPGEQSSPQSIITISIRANVILKQ